ncbi:MAG: tetratricopeptide repeat protein [Deltaproteobacteria bacterium]|nr:tetratricopeptide repeat protein [Deltaproteobacteria bacterium]
MLRLVSARTHLYPRSPPRLIRPLRLLPLAIVSMGIGAAASEPLGADATTPYAQRLGVSYERYTTAVRAHDLESAAVYARRSYQLAQAELGPDEIQTGILAFNLGAVSLELKRYSDATPPLEHAVRVYRLHYGEHDERNLPPERRLAESLQNLERWQQSERHYVRVLKIIESRRGREDPDLGGILIELVNVATELEAWKRTRSYGLRAIGVLKLEDQDDDVPLGLLHVRLAGNELRLSDVHRAVKHMDAALDILELRLAGDDTRWGPIYVLASQTYGYAGNAARARRYKRNARKLGYEVPEPEEE